MKHEVRTKEQLLEENKALRERIAQLEARVQQADKRLQETLLKLPGEEATEELRRSEERYRALFDRSRDIVYIHDFQGNFLDANPAALELLGFGREEIHSTNFATLLDEEQMPKALQTLEILKETGSQPEFTEFKLTSKRGEHVYVETIASVIYHGTQPYAIQGIARDVTWRKQAEETLKQSREQLRSLAMRLAEVEEAQRRRLARELHDQTAQILTAMGINLNFIRGRLPASPTGEVSRRLDDLGRLIEEGTERVRQVMSSLRPSVLDDYGLLAALTWYSEQWEHRTGIRVEVQGRLKAPRLPTTVETALFRIAQEALTNVAKHAQASQVTVAVEETGERISLTIADQGVGFHPPMQQECGKAQRWGLLTMQERARAIGGILHVESAIGQGTRVVVVVDRKK